MDKLTNTFKYLLNKSQLKIQAAFYCSQNSLKAFKDLPAPKEYPLIGHTYLFLPGGKYKTERLTEAIQDLSKTLGPIFRLNLGGTNVLCTVDADHTETLFRNEGKHPIRPSFPALIHYREKAFNSVGVVPGNGEEWYKFRKGVNALLQPNIVKAYENIHEKIAHKFIEYIQKNVNKDLILEDVFKHMFKYTIEAISVVSPGAHFGCLLENSKDSEEIIEASIDFMDGLYATFLGPPLWKLFKTTGYKKLETSHSTIYRIMKSHLHEITESYKSDPDTLQAKSPYMFSLLNNSALSEGDKIMLAVETFLGGIDATATTIALTLHYLAHNRQVQAEAALESMTHQTSPLSYLRACLKETLRLCPTGGANARFTIHDTEIGGYLIPKNTLVSAFSSVMSIEEKYFENADQYRPERWLRGANIKHRFASLPFGFGARMCPGRRIAEQEILILLKEIVKSFTLEPVEDQKIGMIYRMNRIPDRAINIKFVKKESYNEEFLAADRKFTY